MILATLLLSVPQAAAPPTAPSSSRTPLELAELLIPERISGHRVETALRRRATAQLLERWLTDPELPASEDGEILRLRLRGALEAEDLPRLLTAIHVSEDGGPGLDLLAAAPFSLSRPLLQGLIGDSEAPMEARLRALGLVLPPGDRATLDRVLAILLPDGPDPLLRRLLGLWEGRVEPQDLPRLEALAAKLPQPAAKAALVLWARKERDPARRLRILDRLLGGDSSLRPAGLHALARGGPDPGLAARLEELLDSPVRGDRQLAEQLLPAFLPPEKLYELYSARLDPALPVLRQGRIMLRMARIPVPEAHAQAAAWLAEGGWADGAVARAVARELAGAPELDPYLDKLLFREEVPTPLRMELAFGRAGDSPSARAYLRRALDGGTPLVQSQAVRALAAADDPRDLALLLGVVKDPQFDPEARGRAAAALASDPRTAPDFLALFDQPGDGYEFAEALVRAAILSGNPQLRARALATARQGFGFRDPEERRGLRLAAWQAQEERPDPSELGPLALQLRAVLRAAPTAFPGGLPDLRRVAGEYPSVQSCARALAAALRAAGCPDAEPPAAFQGQRVGLAEVVTEAAPGALILASAILRPALPDFARQWCARLALRPGLDPSTRLRVQAGEVRAALDLGPRQAAAAFATLLGEPEALRAYPWDLAYGLEIADALGWVLPYDRIHEEWRLAVATAEEDPTARLALLEPLLQGYAGVGILSEAAALARASRLSEGPVLALRLARRAVDWGPLNARAWLEVGLALRASGGSPREAENAWRTALRLASPGSPERSRARALLGG